MDDFQHMTRRACLTAASSAKMTLNAKSSTVLGMNAIARFSQSRTRR